MRLARKNFEWIVATAMAAIMLCGIIAIAGCGPMPHPDAAPPAIVTKEVVVKVREACIDAADVPANVPATELTGGAKHDATALGATNWLLRAQIGTLMALVGGCTR